MNDEKIIPLLCFGYCFIGLSFVKDKDDIPEKSRIISTTWEEAKRAGWTVTRHIRFSPDCRPVTLCPDCSKRWEKERRLAINALEEYLMDKTITKKEFIGIKREIADFSS